jgi:glycosyltransferase involved in cell wall biosynthesis
VRSVLKRLWRAPRIGRVRAERSDEPRIAYLCDQYPAVSHTFILREVRGLREIGVNIETISIRRSDPAHLLASSDREEFGRTFAVLPVHPLRLIVTHVRVFAANPGRYLATLRLAWSLSKPGLRGRLWQLFYLAEAGVVLSHCRRRRIWHLHAEFATPAADVGLLTAHLGGQRWSWSFAAHGTDIFEADARVLAEKVRRARFVICTSDFGRSQLMALVDERHWRGIHVVPCGIDVRQFASPSGRHVESDGRFHVLTVGRLVAVKGHAVLLEAIRELRDLGVAVTLDVVGDGPRRGVLEDRARALRVTDLVRFHGPVGQDDIRRHYAVADAFCLPSFAEGVPVVLMEAMATEVPVVASGVMGIPELVEDGKSGLLVRPGRPRALADALARLAASADLRRELGRAGRARVESAFSLERSLQALYAIYLADGAIAPFGPVQNPTFAGSAACARARRGDGRAW